MPEIIAAIDETLDGEYLAFVVGESGIIAANAKTLPKDFRHMTSICSKEAKKEILDRLSFQGNIRVCCVKFGLPSLRVRIERMMKSSSGRQRISISTIKNKVAYEFVRDIKILYQNFAIKNGITVDDLWFEADNATVKRYLHDGGLRFTDVGDAHKIADCVVHANGHHWKVNDRVKDYHDDFKNSFHARVIKSLTR